MPKPRDTAGEVPWLGATPGPALPGTLQVDRLLSEVRESLCEHIFSHPCRHEITIH